MKRIAFDSWLAAEMSRFVEWRGSLGRDPLYQADMLSYFDRFLVAEQLVGPSVTAQITDRYFDSLTHLSSSTQAQRSSVVRSLCAFIQQADETHHIPQLRKRRREPFRPFIFTASQVQALLSAALKLTMPDTLHPLTHYTLFGLLYATGMRIGEALALTLGDFDVQRKSLYIAKGKFRKARWVPLHPTSMEAVTEYIERRRGLLPNGPAASLFVNLQGRPLRHRRVHRVYQRLLRSAGISPSPQGPPRIHDLRHSFAVHRLLEWYRDGGDVNARLPMLATYMGHVDICSTQVYLQPTEELLDRVNSRFHQHYLDNVKPKGKTQ